jgi:long-chain acyl-CoA synthetase
MRFIMREENQINIGSVLRSKSDLFRSKLFITDENRAFTYGETESLVNRFCHFLLSKQIKFGDRVAIQLYNSIDFVVIYNAIIRLGAIVVPIGFTLKPREVNSIIADCNPALVIRHERIHNAPLNQLVFDSPTLVIQDNELVEQATWQWLPNTTTVLDIVPVKPNTPLGILYSSGTTGEAKGVLLSHNNIYTNMESARICYQITDKDRTILFLPLSHCFGLNAILNCITHAGASMVIMRKFSLPALYTILDSDTITMFFAVPFIYNLLLNELTNYSLFDKTNYFFSAASKLALETEIRWENRFSRPIHQGYGLTETSPFASYVPRDQYLPGTIGIPVAEVAIKIVDANHADVPVNGIGEIAIKGPNVMLGYYNNPTLTASVIIDNWFYTGDVGYIDENGLLYISDRIKDMVIVKGENVYPTEVENVLLSIPAINEVAVYGIPDKVSDEKVCARIVLNKNAQITAETIIEYCKQNLAPFKVPTIIKFVEALPKSPSGKILKRLMREEDK